MLKLDATCNWLPRSACFKDLDEVPAMMRHNDIVLATQKLLPSIGRAERKISGAISSTVSGNLSVAAVGCIYILKLLSALPVGGLHLVCWWIGGDAISSARMAECSSRLLSHPRKGYCGPSIMHTMATSVSQSGGFPMHRKLLRMKPRGTF